MREEGNKRPGVKRGEGVVNVVVSGRGWGFLWRKSGFIWSGFSLCVSATVSFGMCAAVK